MSKVLKHKTEVIEVLINTENLTEDVNGNFYTIDKKARFKPKKTSLRCENKGETKWIKAWSAYYKNIDVKDGKLEVKKVI